ncbi:hypothetical protein ACSBM8_12250 [Sphingomonas sp. ASY06-1R]|uniref:hypothetical protein n=1 Tax=Sphingomonas sp. ASY06-1R TaxID=3445771 RepID=UPI003FA2AA27
MQRDERLMAAARAIYDACFTLAPIGFDEAGRRGTLHHRRAMAAAEQARAELCEQDAAA